MPRFLSLLSLLVLSLLGVACTGDVPEEPYIPASNYLAINLSTTEMVLDPGGNFAAKALGTPVGLTAAHDLTQYVQWNSNNPTVASVNSDGIIFANNPGFATIKATLFGDDGSTLESGTLVVRVTGTPATGPAEVTLVSLTIRRGDGSNIASTLSMTTDESLEFDVIGKFSDDTSRAVGGVTYRISDPTVAEIGSDGILTPLKPGIISLNARLGSVESNYVVIQINAAP